MAQPGKQVLHETIALGSLTVPRVWNGLWQVSGNAWGSAPVSRMQESMARLVNGGFYAFADHYGNAEIIFGQFRQSLPSPQDVVGATKWCVFGKIDPTLDMVRAAVAERLERMQWDKVDLLQFHWQNYSDRGYLTALGHLRQLQGEGLITTLGLCNFDSVKADEICTHLGPGGIVSNQVQFSLIDTRPKYRMGAICKKHNMKLLTYGTLCGGFLSEKWLGKAEPDTYADHLTPSQRKYLDMIRSWGSWELFQDMLSVLKAIGKRHEDRSIANIATRWVLDHTFVGAVLVGVRLGISDHPTDNQKALGFQLDERDRAEIQKVLGRSNENRLIFLIGDCGSEYR